MGSSQSNKKVWASSTRRCELYLQNEVGARIAGIADASIRDYLARFDESHNSDPSIELIGGAHTIDTIDQDLWIN